MRLINARTLDMCEFFGTSTPSYAILSHTWGNDEVTLQDWQDRNTARSKAGFAKIQGACARAQEDGIEWVWVDTNCIDKTSSAELSEAINSMFAYYRDSKVCYAYLADVSIVGESLSKTAMSQIRASRWFTRGWTLQELLAPRNLIFYDDNWSQIGRRGDRLASLISEVTGIEEAHLQGNISAEEPCIAVKMSWLSRRTTTRAEDMAYCMLGIFDINMPLLYGEGVKAFTRLQEEIIKVTNDHTIFCWTWNSSVPGNWTSLLAPSPTQFVDSNLYSRQTSNVKEISIYTMTNAGLSIRAPILYSASSYCIVLQAGPTRQGGHQHPPSNVYVPICGKIRGDQLHVSRIAYPPAPLAFSMFWVRHAHPEHVLVKHRSGHVSGMSDAQQSISQTIPSSSQYRFTIHFGSRSFIHQWKILPSGPVGPDIFDRFLSTFTLPVPATISPIAAGVALVPATRRPTLHTKDERAYIFLGVKVSQDRIRRYCQIFPWDHHVFLDSKRYQGALESLEKQVLRIDTLQEAYYCASMDVSFVIDDPPHHSRVNGNACALHVSEGLVNEYNNVQRAKGMRRVTNDGTKITSDDAVPPLKVHTGRGLFRLPF